MAKKQKRGTVFKQVAALPVQHGEDGTLRVLLVTSRETHRWTIPKGWPMKRLKHHKAAAQEAREEAGIEGRIEKKPVGSYLYWKRRKDRFDLCKVAVYRMDVRRLLPQWQEQGERDIAWFTVKEAAERVLEPELQTLIARLETRPAKR